MIIGVSARKNGRAWEGKMNGRAREWEGMRAGGGQLPQTTNKSALESSKTILLKLHLTPELILAVADSRCR